MSASKDRAHIEFIQRQDLRWARAELVDGLPPVDQKILSCDDEQTALTAIVRLKAGWVSDTLVRQQGACEFFMLAGCLLLRGGQYNFELSQGGYLRIEDKQLCGTIEATVDTEFLFMTGIGPEPTSEAGKVLPRADCVFVESERIEWEVPWVPGPDPGLKIKLLWRNELTGAYTRLIKAAPGWTEKRQEHHDCVEEVYMLSGDMTMGSLGTMSAGGYIWRPAGIKHGPMHTCEGGLMFIRTDGPLKNYYTDVNGAPLNY